MSKERDQIRENRRRLQKEFSDLFQAIAEVLFRHDPIQINFESNTDEYEPEVGTILPKLRECHSVDDVRHMVHREFVTWFDLDLAGPENQYSQIAIEIWELWQKTEIAKKV